MFNNAAIAARDDGRIGDVTPAVFARVMALDTTGTYRCTRARAAAPESGGGSIVNNASVAALVA